MNITERLPQGHHPLQRASRALAKVEIACGGLLLLGILLLMLLNMIARGFGAPQVWTDELGAGLMVWLAFIGASVAIATKTHMVMGLLPETLSARSAAWVALLCDLAVLAYLMVMCLIIWNWLDLPGLWAAGSGQALAAQSFNFIYTDPTLTLGVRKIWFWLIIPLSTLSSLVHIAATLIEDRLRLREALQ